MKIAKWICIYSLVILAGLLLWSLAEKLFFTGIISFQWFITLSGIILVSAGIYFGRSIFERVVVHRETEIIEREIIIEKEKENRETLSPVNSFLSTRETEILQLIEKGYTNQKIAKELYISLNTVKTHVANIYIKLDVGNRTSALAKARAIRIF